MDVEHGWLAAAAVVQAEIDAEVRDEAHEVFVAEAARSRLTDLVGPARLTLRCGVIASGTLDREPVERLVGHLALRCDDDAIVHVRASAVIEIATPGSRLRREGAAEDRSVASWLREAWVADIPVRSLLCTGRWVSGRIAFVGADHVDVRSTGSWRTIALDAVEAWSG